MSDDAPHREEQPPHSKWSGTVIDGRYHLGATLGAGSTGIVYKGVQISVDRPVAVKLLHPSYQDIAEAQGRFSREAKVVARLNHPNCITLHDFGYDEAIGSLFMVVEYIDGESLFATQKRRRLDLRRVVDIGTQIAAALEHAHQLKILHRDLKPENVLLTLEGQVKVLDFGLAHLLDEIRDSSSQNGGQARLTHEGALYGSPGYMSPEQCQGASQLTPASDLYALGVMLFELVQGELPYHSPQLLELLQMHINLPIPPLTAQGLPSDLRKLIMGLLQKSPQDRPQSAAEVRRALEDVAGRLEPLATLSAKSEPDASSDRLEEQGGSDDEADRYEELGRAETAVLGEIPALSPAYSKRAWGLASVLLIGLGAALFWALGPHDTSEGGRTPSSSADSVDVAEVPKPRGVDSPADRVDAQSEFSKTRDSGTLPDLRPPRDSRPPVVHKPATPRPAAESAPPEASKTLQAPPTEADPAAPIDDHPSQKPTRPVTTQSEREPQTPTSSAKDSPKDSAKDAGLRTIKFTY